MATGNSLHADDIDVSAEAATMLEGVANSLYDRNPSSSCNFTIREIRVLEDHLKKLLSPFSKKSISPFKNCNSKNPYIQEFLQ